MKKITLNKILLMKKKHLGISCLTSYDASFSKLIDSCGVEVILVGDSLGEVIKGDKNTHRVTKEDIIYHTKAVAAGIRNSYLISDLPINTYRTNIQTLNFAKKLIQECGSDMVKLETDKSHIGMIKFLKKNNIPVCAHIGIKPQRIKYKSQYKKQGITEKEKKDLLEEALQVEKAGADLLIIECINSMLAKKITKQLKIPVIGIASGKDCDGQILVLYDLLGISYNGIPNFVNNKNYNRKTIEERIKIFIKKTKKFQRV